MSSRLAIGIDLGTTNSCVAVYRNNILEIIADEKGNRTTPSYVAFSNNQQLIGGEAKAQATANPSNTVFDVKRFIGRRFNDETVQKDLKHLPYNIIDHNGKPNIEIKHKGQTRKFCPEEISSMILYKMKLIAKEYLETEVIDAVITVPAYFNIAQRQATKNAGLLAGLNVLRIINEPTAAAIAYGLDKRSIKQNILVFDLGGGTFDVSILTFDDGIFEVKFTFGDTHLGGEDFDNALVEHCIENIKSVHNIDNIENDKRALQLLRTECEKAKSYLSNSLEAEIKIKSLFGKIDFYLKIYRTEFEELCRKLFESIIKIVGETLQKAKFETNDIDEIILVGGSTRIPLIQQMLQMFFRGKKLNKTLNTDEVVASGAAIQAAIINDELSEDLSEMLLLDLTPLSLGVEEFGGLMAKMIKANTTIPTYTTEKFTTNLDFQEHLRFKIYEGERLMAKDNNLLGEFVLEGIQRAPRYLAQIDVTFKIDANGILNVTAFDRDSGNQNQITLTNDCVVLSKKEIEKMRLQADVNQEKDQKEYSRVFSWNILDNFVYQIQNALKDVSCVLALISKDELKEINLKVNEIFEWLQCHVNATEAKIKSRQNELINICSPIFQIYDMEHEIFAQNCADIECFAKLAHKKLSSEDKLEIPMLENKSATIKLFFEKPIDQNTTKRIENYGLPFKNNPNKLGDHVIFSKITKGRTNQDIEFDFSIPLENILTGYTKCFVIRQTKLNKNEKKIFEDINVKIVVKPGTVSGTRYLLENLRNEKSKIISTDIVFVACDKPHIQFKRVSEAKSNSRTDKGINEFKNTLDANANRQMESNVDDYVQLNLLLKSLDNHVIVTANTSVFNKQKNNLRTATCTFELNEAVDEEKSYKIFSIFRTDIENICNEPLSENKLAIFHEFSVQLEQNKIANDEVSSEVLESFDDKQKFVYDLEKIFHSQEMTCDVTFVVGDARFMARKSILAECSSEFMRLFYKSTQSNRTRRSKRNKKKKKKQEKKNWRNNGSKRKDTYDEDEEDDEVDEDEIFEQDDEVEEKEEKKEKKVEKLEEKVITEFKIYDIEANVFEQTLRYIYTGKIPQINENIEGFLYASDKYKLESLKQICEVEMCKQLSIDNMYYTLMIADRTNADMLKTKALEYSKDHNSVEFFFQHLNQYPSDNERLIKVLRDTVATPAQH